MKIKVKCQPEDFIVEEKVLLTFAEAGPYTVYTLRKSDWNTADAVRQIAHAWKLKYADIAYGGKKDRHGQTLQYITIRNGQPKSLELKNILVQFKGYLDRPMGPDMIEGNLFKTVVRDLTPEAAAGAAETSAVVAANGFINYFDDQRFRSFDPIQGFLAERLLKSHLSGALKSYLVSTHPQDKKEERERKAFISEHWKDWQACLGAAKTSFEKRVFARLVNDAKGFLSLIEDIPSDDLHMAVSAYQSFLWNDIVRRLLLSRGWAERSYPGQAGDYLFFDRLNGRDYEYLKLMTIQHPAAKAEMPDKIVGKIYEKVLSEREIQPALFNKMKTRVVFFKPTPRKVLVKPRDTSFRVEDDDVYPGKKKLLLEFFLPRGSYATMFLKRIFAQPLV